MGLFKADLYRSFALGFVLGAIGLVAAMSGASGSVSQALAAPASSVSSN